MFWTGLIVVEAFLAVAGLRVLAYSQGLGWGMVGAVCGGFCAANLMHHRLWGSLVSGLLGMLSMIGVFLAFREPLDLERGLDIVGAFFVGLVLWHFVAFMRWFQKTSRQPRVVLAAWLTLSVLIGNYAVSLGGW